MPLRFLAGILGLLRAGLVLGPQTPIESRTLRGVAAEPDSSLLSIARFTALTYSCTSGLSRREEERRELSRLPPVGERSGSGRESRFLALPSVCSRKWTTALRVHALTA